jgi:hypothetical protein
VEVFGRPIPGRCPPLFAGRLRALIGYVFPQMRRSELPPHKSATYVLPRWKVVYVSVPKAACTSIKWLIVDLQQESPGRFHRALTREVARATTIHRRRRWHHTPMLHQLSDNELAAVGPDQGWFTFAVVRHPTARLWSAWQSKFLLREPKYLERFGGAPWFPRLPRTTQDVVGDFQAFVRSIADDPEQLVMRDRHFRPQSELLTPDRMPYTKIYETREIPQLLDDLATHLRERGWDGSLALRASNETPLRPLASMFTPEITAAIREVYREDFQQLPYERVEPDTLEPSYEYDESALRAIGGLVERAERIGDLALRAQRLAAANRAKQNEIEGLTRRITELAGAGRSAGVARKVRRTMSRALNRA